MTIKAPRSNASTEDRRRDAATVGGPGYPMDSPHMLARKLKGGGQPMEPITIREIESIEQMMHRYTDHFDLDELNEDEDHAILYNRVLDAYRKVRPEPAKVDPETLKTITKEETEAIHELIEALVEIFEYVGVKQEELHKFECLCGFYKRLVPTWEGPKSLNVALRY